jgi:hypothetical protein
MGISPLFHPLSPRRGPFTTAERPPVPPRASPASRGVSTIAPSSGCADTAISTTVPQKTAATSHPRTPPSRPSRASRSRAAPSSADPSRPGSTPARTWTARSHASLRRTRASTSSARCASRPTTMWARRTRPLLRAPALRARSHRGAGRLQGRSRREGARCHCGQPGGGAAWRGPPRARVASERGAGGWRWERGGMASGASPDAPCASLAWPGPRPRGLAPRGPRSHPTSSPRWWS